MDQGSPLSDEQRFRAVALLEVARETLLDFDPGTKENLAFEVMRIDVDRKLRDAQLILITGAPSSPTAPSLRVMYEKLLEEKE